MQHVAPRHAASQQPVRQQQEKQEPQRTGIRPDIQVLRCLAVLSVVLFHLFPGQITGGYVGVDVFFVISGFLITSHLLREVSRSGRISLVAFWSRRARRLLPAAFVVLIVTLGVTLLAAPKVVWKPYLSQISASALYWQNWKLAANSVDYFAADQKPSPAQHYWSLSVEEQFYVVWPLLLVALVFIARRLDLRRRSVSVCLGFVAVFGGSLVYSALVEHESYGYFSTFTHAWEFAAGGILGLFAERASAFFSRHRLAAPLASWLGLAGILYAVVRFTGSTPFPGTAALLPVAGTLLVLAAGVGSGAGVTDRLLRLRPLQWVGDVSYSLYLWHWPPIVLLPWITSHPLRPGEKLAILVGALVAAGLTRTFVENRFRLRSSVSRRTVLRTLAALVPVTALIVGSCDIAASQSTTDTNQLVQQITASVGGAQCFGAAAVLSGATCPAPNVLTTADAATLAAQDNDLAGWLAEQYPTQKQDPADCPKLSQWVRECVWGSSTAKQTVALVGDSHARALLPAVVGAAKAHGWRLEFMWHADCRPVVPLFKSTVAAENGAECVGWKNQVIDTVTSDKRINVVITAASTRRYANEMPGAANQNMIASAFKATWSRWTAAGKNVVVALDVPFAADSVPGCVAAAGTLTDPCAAPRASAIPTDPLDLATTPDVPPGVSTLDLTIPQCDATLCHFAVGGLVTHVDTSHLSVHYAATLAPLVDSKVSQVLSSGGGAECLGANAVLGAHTCSDVNVLASLRAATIAANDRDLKTWLNQQYPGQKQDPAKCPKVTAAVRRCSWGSATAKVTVAVVGDAHARSVLPAVVAAAKTHGWRVQLFWRSGCRPVLPQFKSAVAVENSPGCRQWQTQVVDWIAHYKYIKVVVTAQASRSYVTQLHGAAKQAAVASAYKATWSRWTKAKKKVVVAEDVPLSPTSVPTCIKTSGKLKDPCAQPRAKTLPTDPVDRASKSSGAKGVSVAHIASPQCDARRCHFAVGGLVTHVDTSNLAIGYASTLAPIIDTTVSKALG
ncbi:MAG TPA: acyltransferase family protein [Jatrophihabitans sp.]